MHVIQLAKFSGNSGTDGSALFRRLFGRVAVLSGGTTLSRAMMFAAFPILTRIFAPESFAHLAFYQAALSVFGLCMTLQYECAIPIPRQAQEARTLLGLALRIGGILAVLGTVVIGLVALAPVSLSWRIPLSVLLVIPVCAYVEAVSRTVRIDFVRHGRFHEMSLARMLQSISTVTAQVILGCCGFAMLGLPLGDGIGRWAAATFFSTRQEAPTGTKTCRATIRQLRETATRYASFAGFMTPAAVLAFLVTQSPALFLPGLYGENFAGQFAVANQAVLLPLLVISQAVTHVYVSDASRMIRNQDRSLPRLVRNTALRMGGLGLVLGLIAAGTGPFLFPSVFGAKWTVAGNIVPWLAISGFAPIRGGAGEPDSGPVAPGASQVRNGSVRRHSGDHSLGRRSCSRMFCHDNDGHLLSHNPVGADDISVAVPVRFR